MCKLEVQMFGRATRLLNLSVLLAAAWGMNVTTSFAQPTNDNFADAEIITGGTGTVFGDNFDATSEPGEPLHVGIDTTQSRSVWYQWTAPISGAVSFDTIGSDFDTVLAVYIGTNVDNLQPVAGNDNYDPSARGPSRVSFTATAGTVYQIAIDGVDFGFGGDGSAEGDITLNWNLGFSSGTFQFTKANYIASDFEDFPPVWTSTGPQAPADLGARITVTRNFGSAGKVSVGYLVDTAFYTNLFITNYFGTNIFITNNDISGITFTNIYNTNITSTNFYQNLVDGRFIETAIPFSKAVTITNDNGNITTIRTNYGNVALTNGPCLNRTTTSITSTTNGTTIIVTNIFCLTDITNVIAAASPGFDGPKTGTLEFDDYQMSKTFLVKNIGPFNYFDPLNFNFDNPANSALTLVLTDATLDPLETEAIAPPIFKTNVSTIEVKRFDIGVIPANNEVQRLPSTLTDYNSQGFIFNFERATFRVGETANHRFVVTRDGTNNGACSVSYRVDFLFPNQNAEHFNNFNLLTAGSDFATPVDPYGQYPSAQPPDFFGTGGVPQLTGTLNWGQDDFVSKNIDIVVADDNLVEFNEDLLLQLYNPTPAAHLNPNGAAPTPGAVVGQIGRAVMTILFDDQPAGAVDRNFNADGSPGTDPYPNNPNPGANGIVFTTATQADNKTVIGGTFSAYNGVAVNRIARMKTDGLLDTTFDPGSGANNAVTALTIAPDGKILAGGSFSSFNGTERHSIARINSNGSLDTTFQPQLGANGTIWSIALQSDGKIVIGGFFTSVNGTNRNHVARLNADGSLDASFDPGTGANGDVFSVAVQPDGKVLIGGDFTIVGGTNRVSIARLNADGTLDASFDPGAGTLDIVANIPGTVYSIALQPDGKIIIGGAFSSVGLQSRNSIARFNANGSLDTSFNPGSGADHTIYTVKLQPDGRILIGGLFASFNGTRRIGIARLLSQGPLDTSFMDTAYNQFAGLINPYFTETNPAITNNTRNVAFTLSLQSDGDVIVGGGFLHAGGGGSRDAIRPRQNVARFIGGATPGPGNIELAYDSYSVTENGERLFVTLTRTNGNLGPASATFAPSTLPGGPGAAVLGKDFKFDGSTYGNPTWQTTWPRDTWMQMDGLSGQNNATKTVLGGGLSYSPDLDNVFIDVLDNSIVDGNKRLNFTLLRPTGTDMFFLGGENIPLGVALGRSASTMDIVDDDKPHGTFRFSSPTYTVNESGTNAQLEVLRDNGSVGPVTVRYAVTNETATNGLDYQTNTDNVLSFAEGETNKTISIPIINDTGVEFDETFYVYLTTPTGGAILSTNGGHEARVTIIDDDFLPGRLNFTAPKFSVNENKTFATVSVSRTGGNVGSMTVQCAATDGTATDGLDFVGTTNTLTWNAGDTSIKTLLVPILNDNLHEEDELVTLRLFNPIINNDTNNVLNGTVLGSVSNAVLVVVDDDPYGDIQFAAPNFFVNENGGSATITVLRVRGSAEPISISYSTRDGSAINGTHYNTSSGVLSFAAGEVSKTFTVPIIDDVDTNANHVVNLDLSNPSPSGVVFQTNATLTIIDNESINEVAGSVDTTFNPFAGANDFVYSLALQPDGKLLFGGDFTSMNQVPRNRIGRLLANGVLDTTFSSIFSTAGANDSVRSMVSQTDGRILIGGLFTKVNDVNFNRIARLNLDGSLDSIFNPGAGANNPVYAVAETFIGSSDISTNRRVLVAGSFTTFDGIVRNGIVRLHNNGEVDLDFDPGSGVNGTNSPIYCMALQLDGKVLIGGDFVSFNGTNAPHIARLNIDGSLDMTFDPQIGPNDSVRAIAVQTDGRIIIGGLFTNVNGTTLNHIARLDANGLVDSSFDPGVGANDSVYAIALQVDGKIVLGGEFTRASGVTRNRLTRLNADGTVDPTINFGSGANSFVTALALQPDGKIVLGGGFTEFDGLSRSRIARLYGGSMNGSGRLEFSSANYQVAENQTNAVITVRRRGSTGSTAVGTVSVDAATSDGTATAGLDYTGTTNTLQFPVGETYATFTIPIINDDLVESDETVLLNLSNTTADDLGNQQTATLTIKNDDAAISFSSATYSSPENALNGNAIITLSRVGSSIGEASVDFIVTTNGTATIDADFTLVTNTVLFADGESNKTVMIPLNNDSQIEGDETVTMMLSNVIGAILSEPSSATLTIVDDDFGPGGFAFSQTNYSFGEGIGIAVVTVIRTNGSQGFVTVDYSAGGIGTATPGVDYAPTNGTLSFGPGESSKTFSITVLEDTIAEGDETLTIALSSPTGGAVISGTNSLPMTIVDNEVGFSFSTPAYVFNEGDGGATITVRRSNGTNSTSAVSCKTISGTASNGLDYIETTNTLVFGPDETFKTFTVSILEDTLVEGDEFFFVTLFDQTGNTQLVSPSNAVVTITDNDSSFNFSATNYVVDEAGTNVIITVARTNSSSGTASVDVTTSNSTATAGSDYIGTNLTLVFLDGETTKDIIIPIVDDSLAEGDEVFSVRLSNPSAGSVLGATSIATVTIIDNDAGLVFSSPTYHVSESGVNATITVLRTTVTNSTVSVNYKTTDGTAVDGQDYVGVAGTLIFTNGETTKTFTVQIIDDTVIEGDETVLLSLSSPFGGATIGNPGAAVMTIGDNDGSLILPAGSALEAESFTPTNGVIDPSETVTLYFSFINTVGVDTTSLVATLLPGGGITNPSPSQNYGVLRVGGNSVPRPFSFTALGTNGQRITATFHLQDGSLDLGTASFTYTLGKTAFRFTNSAAIIINDSSSPPTKATNYPSQITVAGVVGTVSKVSVTLSNLNHTFPDDIDMLLVSPTGQKIMLMSDAGGPNAVANLSVTFDDTASGFIPDSSMTSGTFKPSDYLSSPPDSADSFPSPAPAGPYSSTLSVLNGVNPNGTWSLYIVDDEFFHSGSVAKGWSLAIETSSGITPVTDLSVDVVHSPEPAATNNSLTYTVTVINHGPSAATGIIITNILPDSVTFVSQTCHCTNTSNVMICPLDSLARGAFVRFNIEVIPNAVGLITNLTYVGGIEFDPNLLNNSAIDIATVNVPRANMAIGLSGSPNPVQINSNLTYSISVSNLGPVTATGVMVTNSLAPGVTPLSANSSQGTYSLVGSNLIFDLGTIAPTTIVDPNIATITIVVQPTLAGIITNVVSVASALEDPLKSNNSASIKTSVELPPLSFRQAANGLQLSWGTNAPGYVLETTTNLSATAVWTRATNSPISVVNGKYVYTLDLSGGSRFFRLGPQAP